MFYHSSGNQAKIRPNLKEFEMYGKTMQCTSCERRCLQNAKEGIGSSRAEEKAFMSSPMWVLRRTSGLQEQDVLLAAESSFQLYFVVLVIRSHSMEREQPMCLVATSEIPLCYSCFSFSSVP